MKAHTLRSAAILGALYASTVFFNAEFHRSLVRHGELDLIEQAFGGFRELVASWAYMKAEEYHHSGLPFLSAMKYHAGEDSLAERSGHDHGGEDHHHAENIKSDLYSKIYAHVHVTQDTHLSAAQEKEMLPWFYIEVKFDPHDIRGYILGAYSLELTKKGDEALRFLKEGERNNPESARILTSLGNYFYSRGSYDVALEYLSRACRLWQEGLDPNAAIDQYEQSDRFLAYNILGSIYEKRGLYAEAVKTYKELFRIDPNKVLLNKIQNASR